VEALVSYRSDGAVTRCDTPCGRRIGNVQRKGLSGRSVNVALTLLSSVLDDAVRQGTLSRNVAKMVERAPEDKHEMKTWTEGQAAAFLEAVADDRLSAAWQLSLYGLRGGEVLGLCWSDVDLQAKTLIIRRARVEVTGSGVVEVGPKTERGKRTLPLDDALASALRSLKARQARERLEAGEAYSSGCGECTEAHVVVDELGWPVRPKWYSDQFRNLAKAAGLPVIRLHDARHTCGTLMHLPGSPHGCDFEVARARHGQLHDGHLRPLQDDALAAAGAMYSTAIRATQSGV
jgi:integrase